MIAKIHFRVLLFFGLLFLTLFFGFVALVEGFTISHLKLGDIKLERVYLKWDNRLHIQASLINLNDLQSTNEPLDLQPLKYLPKAIKYAEQWIASVDIQNIVYHGTSLSLHYFRNQEGQISFNNGNNRLDGHFRLSPESLNLTFLSPSSAHHKMDGYFRVNIAEQTFSFESNLSLPNTPMLHGYIAGNTTKLTIKLESNGAFTQIATLTDFIGVDPDIRPWIVDNTQFKTAFLRTCEGEFIYDKPEAIVTSLNIHATALDVQYTFDPKISPIKAPSADIYFQKGKLHIVPNNGTFYTLPAQKSHLYIDFTTPHTMLNAFIRSTQGQLNNDILFLLNHYDIKIPLRQNSGVADVDLNLSINLHDISITAKGRFTPSPSEIEMEGFLFKTTGGSVFLDNSKVEFHGFDVHYKNIANAKVNGNFDGSKGDGEVIVLPYFCAPSGNSSHLSLLTSSNPPKITYLIRPIQDTVEISSAEWSLYGEKLHSDSLLIPIDYKKGEMLISKLPLTIPDKCSGYLSGTISTDSYSLALHLDTLNINNLSLLSKESVIHINPQSNDIVLSTPSSSLWEIGGQAISFSPSSVLYKDSSFIFNNINILLKDQFKGILQGEYSTKTEQGTLQLSNIEAINPNISRYIDTSHPQNLLIDASKEELKFHSKTLGIDVSNNNLGWNIEIADISFLSKNSPLLSYYDINNGKIILVYSPTTKRLTFDGVVEYPYSLMMVNGKSLSTYRFGGSFFNDKTTIRLNDRVTIMNDDTLHIRANNMGINGRELLRWLSDRKSGSNKISGTSSKAIHLNGNNLYLYLMENRKILIDTIDATLNSNNELDARITHGIGGADITMKDSLFYAEGANFGDHFMENIFAFSDFDGGNLSFKLSGKTDKFEGIMRIDDVILKEYKVLNNVLSFINTIPSLTTFSLPNYSTKGLRVKDTYAHFTYQNHIFNIDNYVLNSPELKIDGSGEANIKDDTLNGTLTLKSDLGSALGKVPVVGYILLGDDGSISTTLNLKGKLSDPIVETGIAKEIVSAPFNILKRTITYPFLWMIPDEKKK